MPFLQYLRQHLPRSLLQSPWLQVPALNRACSQGTVREGGEEARRGAVPRRKALPHTGLEPRRQPRFPKAFPCEQCNFPRKGAGVRRHTRRGGAFRGRAASTKAWHRLPRELHAAASGCCLLLRLRPPRPESCSRERDALKRSRGLQRMDKAPGKRHHHPCSCPGSNAALGELSATMNKTTASRDRCLYKLMGFCPPGRRGMGSFGVRKSPGGGREGRSPRGRAARGSSPAPAPRTSLQSRAALYKPGESNGCSSFLALLEEPSLRGRGKKKKREITTNVPPVMSHGAELCFCLAGFCPFPGISPAPSRQAGLWTSPPG
ncbi:uncharacterized protein LOC118172416 [Oxyura jamaicensis]|uniref:uncharacterized protein LOC118172416 n=1 Tax=Oxyura jamaicensis TaxID=8884 RepID=UPI0015A6F391|nr:uncharacterized protein LOC118172416 [Oxyura jamaicensis]